MNIQPRLNTLLNKKLSPAFSEHGYNLRIEQYRGLCALLVMINHATVHADLLLNNFSWPGYMHYFGAPFLSVLVFFCISGYVIGVNYNSSDFSVADYLKKRAIRLYPIYIFSFLLCLIVADKIPVFQLLGNLLFLQNEDGYGLFKVPVFVNYSIWSLNYEMIYYLFFIILFYWQP